MKVNRTVSLELSREELEAVQIVYNMLYNLEMDEENELDQVISNGTSVEDVRCFLFDVWDSSGHDTDKL